MLPVILNLQDELVSYTQWNLVRSDFTSNQPYKSEVINEAID